MPFAAGGGAVALGAIVAATGGDGTGSEAARGSLVPQPARTKKIPSVLGRECIVPSIDAL